MYHGTVTRGEKASVSGFIVVRRGETRVFRALERNFEAPIAWDRRIAERRVSRQPVARDSREAERRSPAPVTWGVYGFLLVPSPESRTGRTPTPEGRDAWPRGRSQRSA